MYFGIPVGRLFSKTVLVTGIAVALAGCERFTEITLIVSGSRVPAHNSGSQTPSNVSPTGNPSGKPTVKPSSAPSLRPSPAPSPSVKPSTSPSPHPSPSSTPKPSPTSSPTPTPTPTPTVNPGGGASFPSGKLYVGYFASWLQRAEHAAADLELAKLPPYYNIVMLSFMYPDANYSGNLNLTGTGLQFTNNGKMIKDAIAILHTKRPGIKVLIAVGGATYDHWDNFHENDVVRFVKDFGLDGVDLDYEPSASFCDYSSCCRFNSATGRVACNSDNQYIEIIDRMRKALPHPYIISTAGWSIGAYGEGEFKNDLPLAGRTGMMLNVLRSPLGSGGLDLINIMSYDAGVTYDPKRALMAYKKVYNGKLVLGVRLGTGVGSHLQTLPEVNSMVDFVNQGYGSGMMIWTIQEDAINNLGSYAFSKTISSRLPVVFGPNTSAPKTYPGIGGVFNWEATYDQNNKFQFASGLKACVRNGNCQ